MRFSLVLLMVAMMAIHVLSCGRECGTCPESEAPPAAIPSFPLGAGNWWAFKSDTACYGTYGHEMGVRWQLDTLRVIARDPVTGRTTLKRSHYYYKQPYGEGPRFHSRIYDRVELFVESDSLLQMFCRPWLQTCPCCVLRSEILHGSPVVGEAWESHPDTVFDCGYGPYSLASLSLEVTAHYSSFETPAGVFQDVYEVSTRYNELFRAVGGKVLYATDIGPVAFMRVVHCRDVEEYEVWSPLVNYSVTSP